MIIDLLDMQEVIEIDPIHLDIMKKAAEKTLIIENKDTEAFEVSITITDNEQIKELNKQYRSINAPTDVLSFSFLEDENEEMIQNQDEIEATLLGDIIISIERAIEQANEYGHSLDRELAFLTIHGVLHLLGYDHMNEEEEKIMFSRQKEILKEMNLHFED